MGARAEEGQSVNVFVSPHAATPSARARLSRTRRFTVRPQPEGSAAVAGSGSGTMPRGGWSNRVSSGGGVGGMGGAGAGVGGRRSSRRGDLVTFNPVMPTRGYVV